MKNEVLKEISRELNWRERIIIKLFPNISYKILNKYRVIVLNSFLKY